MKRGRLKWEDVALGRASQARLETWPEVYARLVAKATRRSSPLNSEIVHGLCWLWEAANRRGVRPLFWYNGRWEDPARVVMCHTLKRDIEEGEVAVRKCGRSLCCNPRHLVLEFATEVWRGKMYPLKIRY